MKVLVLFLFTENPTLPYKTRGKLSFLFLKKKKRQQHKRKQHSEWNRKERDGQRESKGKRDFLIQCSLTLYYIDFVLNRHKWVSTWIIFLSFKCQMHQYTRLLRLWMCAWIFRRWSIHMLRYIYKYFYSQSIWVR